MNRRVIIVSSQQSAVSSQQSAVSRQQSAVSSQQSAVSSHGISLPIFAGKNFIATFSRGVVRPWFSTGVLRPCFDDLAW